MQQLLLVRHCIFETLPGCALWLWCVRRHKDKTERLVYHLIDYDNNLMSIMEWCQRLAFLWRQSVYTEYWSGMNQQNEVYEKMLINVKNNSKAITVSFFFPNFCLAISNLKIYQERGNTCFSLVCTTVANKLTHRFRDFGRYFNAVF